MSHNRKKQEKRSKRRLVFFHDKNCLLCNSIKKLELHHRNPEEKEDGDIWNWSEERRLKEIAKCDVLCLDCHKKEHVKLGSYKGENNGRSKLTEEDVVEIKIRLANDENINEIVKDFDIKIRHLYNIRNGTTWRHVVI